MASNIDTCVHLVVKCVPIDGYYRLKFVWRHIAVTLEQTLNKEELLVPIWRIHV